MKIFGSIIILLYVNIIYAVREKTPKGALLSVKFNGKIGFNLDEILSCSLKQVKDYIQNSVTEDDWLSRIKMQITATLYRQVFRAFYFYPKLQLTLPPEQSWRIKLTSEPIEETIQNHLYISRTYSFYSVVIGRADSVDASEPLLNQIGGKYNDTLYVPVDPEHLFQRTGYACVDEASLSLDTITSENAFLYFDQECKVEEYIPIENRTFDLNQQLCHWTNFPNVTCIQALEQNVGYTDLIITWKRIKWNEKIANEFRYGEQTSQMADLMGVKENLIEQINIGYKFFSEDSCTLKEGGANSQDGCIRAPGWRQLLRFTSSSINVGKTVLHLGNVFDNEYIARGIFEFDKCHLHYHFQHYENYLLADLPGRKTGFCLQTTWRYHNNEWTPFSTPYSNCTYQGISVGWGDDYNAGLDCQWIDVTSLVAGQYTLTNSLNPDNFICEGVPKYDCNGSLKWIETDFLTTNNTTVYRQDCNFTKNYDKNNKEEFLIDFKGPKSIVTLPCKRNATLSPTKDCGFDLQLDNLKCEPSEKTTIKLKNTGNTVAIIRLCETSKMLGYSTQCEYINKLANVQIKSKENETINFICPEWRSNEEPGGLFSVLVSTLLPNKKVPKVIRIKRSLKE